jgi:hypothetical protein
LRYGFFTRFSPLFFKTFILFCCLFYSIKNEHGNKRADQTPKLRKDVKKREAGDEPTPTREEEEVLLYMTEKTSTRKKKEKNEKKGLSIFIQHPLGSPAFNRLIKVNTFPLFENSQV